MLEDAQVLEPVLFVAMPHVWNHMYAEYIKEIKHADNGFSIIFSFCLFIEKFVLEKYSKILGKRIKLIGND